MASHLGHMHDTQPEREEIETSQATNKKRERQLHASTSIRTGKKLNGFSSRDKENLP